MGANNFLPHVLVLPEDGANIDIANGFFLEIPFAKQRAFQVLPPARGWHKVVHRACSGDCEGLRSHPLRHLVLLIDFDEKEDRLSEIRQKLPSDLVDRIFILGSRGEPEDLPRRLGTLEGIGKRLAEDCRDGTDATWSHELLAHNTSELVRAREALRDMLFP